MVNKIYIVCIMMLGSASLACRWAGRRLCPPCGPYPYSAKFPWPPPSSPYWGDAVSRTFGGVVALPFLVVGSLLGGNTAGPMAPTWSRL
jgi:hypothetical protein